MNVLLIIPQFKSVYKGRHKADYYFPLGIAYISSFLKDKGINVNVYNGALVTMDDSYSLLNGMINRNNIDIVGIGGLTAEYREINYFSKIVKQIKRQIKIIIGGGFVSGSPKEAMELVKEADYGIIGQGEVAFLRLVKYIDGEMDFESVINSVYRNDDGNICFSKKEYIELDLDRLPYPDYEGMGFDVIIKKNFEIIGQTIIPIIASRSCPFSCTFCFHPSGEVYKKRSFDSITGEIIWLKRKYNPDVISLIDELFIDDIEFIKKFSEFMSEQNIKWECCARVNNITEELLEILKKGGCKRISYGLESADDNVLISMKKGINQRMITNALKLTKSVGIEAVGAFIFGDIREDTETVKNSLEYFLKHPEYAIDLNLLRVFPGSADYNYAVNNKIITDKLSYIKNGCPNINISRLSESEFKNLKYYLEDAIAKKVRLPLNFTATTEKYQTKFEYICPVCRKKIISYNSSIADTIENFCDVCAEYFHFSYMDFYTERVVESLRNIKGKIILFTINHISLKLYSIYDTHGKIYFWDDRYSIDDVPIISYEELHESNNTIINCSLGSKDSGLENCISIDRFLEKINEQADDCEL